MILFIISVNTVLKSQELFELFNDTVKQGKKTGYQIKPNSKEVEINFLSSYYQQDGNNSAVTGGIGTEKLNDFANVILINIPLDSINSVSVFGGADAYTSASSDNIDSNVSSASKEDVRGYGTISYNRKNLMRAETYSVRAGFSKEFDYTSFSAGLSYTKEFNEGNTELNFTTQAFLDKWKIIYPEMYLLPVIYDDSYLLTKSNRNSYNAQIFLSQVINKRLQVGISAEIVYMNGLLSTPFHSVYFADMEDYLLDIERLPGSRIKFPFGIRMNYFPFSFLVLRSNYRFYTDDFGITAHSIDFEIPLKLNSTITISPFYRYHTQTASKYFAPYKQHLSTETYYTSDYDLSDLYSHKYGIGFKYYPTYGILRSNPLLGSEGILTQLINPVLEKLNRPVIQKSDFQGVFMFKYIELRVANYIRSTDFNAFNISLNLGLGIK